MFQIFLHSSSFTSFSFSSVSGLNFIQRVVVVVRVFFCYSIFNVVFVFIWISLRVPYILVFVCTYFFFIIVRFFILRLFKFHYEILIATLLLSLFFHFKTFSIDIVLLISTGIIINTMDMHIHHLSYNLINIFFSYFFNIINLKFNNFCVY